MELMSVVTIVGILAALAIPSFVSYSRRARTSEATTMLGDLYHHAASYYVAEYPPGRSAPQTFSGCVVDSAGPLPAVPRGVAAYPDWESDPSFSGLGFASGGALRYGYEIVSVGGCRHGAGEALYSFRAIGDLDGDGATSLFEVAAGSNSDNVLMRTPGHYVESELE